ncbi:amino acid ABC transporter permease [Nocardioides zeae]|uniref:Amino acid ABC transporter permease n=1 Tax=Nocardioides zeae TaxID=1457234 RepID=A0A6P0HPV7_9ACTN|nr:amino acid ABC transporter permease [Nocardioides zeae]NEN80643.1 amino acid ABC transporter permease [Nocardioides zeae]
MTVMEHLQALAGGIGTTVTLTLAAFGVGAVAGFPLALARRSSQWWLRLPALAVIEVLRAIPPLVWLFIVFYVIGADFPLMTPFQAAVAGLGLIAAAYLAEIYRAGLDAVPDGQWEAASATGIGTLTTYRKVVLPQAALIVVPPAATYLIALLKDSAVASVVGTTDITFLAFQEARVTLEGFEVFVIAAALYLALSAPVALVARTADRLISRRLGL